MKFSADQNAIILTWLESEITAAKSEGKEGTILFEGNLPFCEISCEVTIKYEFVEQKGNPEPTFDRYSTITIGEVWTTINEEPYLVIIDTKNLQTN